MGKLGCKAEKKTVQGRRVGKRKVNTKNKKGGKDLGGLCFIIATE